LDGKEQELCKTVDTKQPLWGVIDIYGNVKGKNTQKGWKCLFLKAYVSR
jgi:hypothetical protein